MNHTRQPSIRFDARETLTGNLNTITVRQAVEAQA